MADKVDKVVKVPISSEDAAGVGFEVLSRYFNGLCMRCRVPVCEGEIWCGKCRGNAKRGLGRLAALIFGG